MTCSSWSTNFFYILDLVNTNLYDKQDDLDFDISNFSFLDGDVSRLTSYGVLFI